MEACTTPSTPPSEARRESSGTSQRERYVIRQRPHPAGFELAVENAMRHVLLLARPRPTEPPWYTILPADGDQEKLLVVKPVCIGLAKRYVLFDGGLEHLSLLPAFSSAEFLLRDAEHRVIARFRPLGPGKVALRSPSMLVARLRLIQYAAPLRLHVHCEIETGTEWLLAVLLYAIAVAEEVSRQGAAFDSVRALLVQPVLNQP